MTLTPKQVIEELAKTGRHVEARTLTDWRSRGLLPKLSDRGRGQGKGKGYFWTDDNILDQVALVADLPSWETDRTVLILWLCNFEIALEQMRAAWLKSIERVSRQLAKQDMNAPAVNTTQLTYFEQLEDALHSVASIFRRQKEAEGDAMSAFAYQLAQLGFSFVLAKSISRDFEWEIENINRHLSRYKPPFVKVADYKFPEIDLEFILSKRKFTNIFEIRNAVQDATSAQLETAQFIWKTICRVIGQLWPDETPAELGLTPARQFQSSFGPMVLSIVVVALQTQGTAALIRIFELVASNADELDAARRHGMREGPKGAAQFWTEKRPGLTTNMEKLWLEFWGGIDHPAARQK